VRNSGLDSLILGEVNVQKSTKPNPPFLFSIPKFPIQNIRKNNLYFRTPPLY
jgi:hypothetical protein